MALACLLVAYAVHALVDYDLDFLAVSAPALVALGALLAVARPWSPRRVGVPGLVAIAAVAGGAVLAVALPALAQRDVDRALEAADAGRVDGGGRRRRSRQAAQSALARPAPGTRPRGRRRR